jgi:hypothetical protein
LDLQKNAHKAQDLSFVQAIQTPRIYYNVPGDSVSYNNNHKVEHLLGTALELEGTLEEDKRNIFADNDYFEKKRLQEWGENNPLTTSNLINYVLPTQNGACCQKAINIHNLRRDANDYVVHDMETIYL